MEGWSELRCLIGLKLLLQFNEMNNYLRMFLAFPMGAAPTARGHGKMSVASDPLCRLYGYI